MMSPDFISLEKRCEISIFPSQEQVTMQVQTKLPLNRNNFDSTFLCSVNLAKCIMQAFLTFIVFEMHYKTDAIRPDTYCR